MSERKVQYEERRTLHLSHPERVTHLDPPGEGYVLVSTKQVDDVTVEALWRRESNLLLG